MMPKPWNGMARHWMRRENTPMRTKLGIVLRKKQQDGPGEDPDNERHSGNAGDTCDHGKPERFPHAVKPLRAPRETRHG